VAQVRELVAERVDHDAVLEQVGRAQLVQPDPDPPVGVADAVAPAHARAFRIDRCQRQLERTGEQLGVTSQSLERATARFLCGIAQARGSGGGGESIPLRA